MLEKDNKVIIETDGIKKEYEIVVEFDCEENGKTYLGFIDNDNANKEQEIYFACYDTELNTGELFEVKTEEEIELINDVLNKIRKHKEK